MKTQCDLESGDQKTTMWLHGKPKIGDRFVFLNNKQDVWTVTKVYTSLTDHAAPDPHDAKRIWRATSGNSPIGHK